MSQFSHLNEAGQAEMVDVADKADTKRVAIAQARVLMSSEVLQQVQDDRIPKGDLFATARIAGIQAAKKCSDLIPLCHPLPLHKVTVDFELFNEEDSHGGHKAGLTVISLCKTAGKTGVEMEALTAASVAALTIYDMCKALDKGIIIESVRLLQKSGGKSGDWKSK